MTTIEFFENNRPVEYKGKGDSFLLEMIDDLFDGLDEVIETFDRPTFQLEENDLMELAIAIIEFGEDFHNGLGFWKAVEDYNDRIFGMTHPLIPDDGDDSPFRVSRVKAFLLYYYEELQEDLIISPNHQNLAILANYVSNFLKQAMPGIPADSGIGHFMASSNKDAAFVKAKLIWLGTKSYLFRFTLINHFSHLSKKINISLLDDFLCQQCTYLSGMGILDVLAAVLDINEEQRAELLSWNQRHMAFYKILSADNNYMELINLINDKPYRVNSGEFTQDFPVGEAVFGSLVPWNGQWYWSGEQKVYEGLTDEKLLSVKEKFLKAAAQISYRYDKESLKNVERIIKIHYKDFLDFFQDDLIIFSDGLDLAAAMQKKDRAVYKSKMSEEELASFMEKHQLNQPNPQYNYPQELLDSTDGIGVFFNPEEGMEFAMNFSHIVSGFEKKGHNLNEDEFDSIGKFVMSYSLSHHFARKVVERYGPESLLTVFCLEGYDTSVAVEFILRKYKGHFYKQRYPNIYMLD